MEKIYISNMCQAGFIHKLTSKQPYQHPFVFCCFMEDDYAKFVEDFDTMDFSNYKKLHYNESKIYNCKDIYTWDGLNRMLGIETENTPTLEFENGVQMIYPHVHYCNFDKKYKTRLNRFLNLQDTEICFIFRVKSFMKQQAVDRFYNCSNYKKILLFDEDVPYKNLYKENQHTRIVITNYEHRYLVNILKRKGILDNC